MGHGIYRQQPIKVSYHLAKFGGQRRCGSEGIMILVCQVISQDHEIKVSFDFLQRLVAIGTEVVEI